MRSRFFLFALVFLLSPTLSLSQTGILQGKEGIYAIVEDFRGERLEGYLSSCLTLDDGQRVVGD